MSSSIKRLPLWFRYLVALGVGAAIVVALVLAVDGSQQPLSVAPASADKSQQVQENRQAKVLVAQQQAPHRARLASHAGALGGAADAITAYMTSQVSDGLINGPLDGQASCSSAGGVPGRAALHCSITAGDRAKNLSLAYPFDAVVQPAADRVTFCQVITSPDPDIPSPAVVAACR